MRESIVWLAAGGIVNIEFVNMSSYSLVFPGRRGCRMAKGSIGESQ